MVDQKSTMRRSRFIGAATVGALAVVGGRAASSSASGNPSMTEASLEQCGGAADYTPQVAPSSGAAGTSAVISGPLPVTGSDGSYEGSSTIRVEAWWNLSFDEWWSAYSVDPPVPDQPGPVSKVGTDATTGQCNYSITIQVPDVSAGEYSVVVLYANSDAVASFEPITFTVTT